jgi:hypothetical protein
MRSSLAIAAAAALLLAVPASASETESAPQPRDEIVCKSNQQPGSHLVRRRLCMKRSEWQAMAQNNRHEVELFQVRQLQMPIRR